MELRCKYCGSLNLETEKKGTQTGARYWVTTQELRDIIER